MTVGLLIITHNRIGQEILETAVHVFGLAPFPVAIISVGPESRPECLMQEARARLLELNKGHGVLILTDLYGATPSNIAAQLCHADETLVITGVNLPMMVRLFNYAYTKSDITLAELAFCALSGGNAGILSCATDADAKNFSG